MIGLDAALEFLWPNPKGRPDLFMSGVHPCHCGVDHQCFYHRFACFMAAMHAGRSMDIGVERRHAYEMSAQIAERHKGEVARSIAREIRWAQGSRKPRPGPPPPPKKPKKRMAK